MTIAFQDAAPARTIHLPSVPTSGEIRKPLRKGLKLSDLRAGETGRVVRLAFPDPGCRKRFAELGLAEGMKVTVTATGDTLMLLLGGSRMGLAARCAEEIFVVRTA